MIRYLSPTKYSAYQACAVIALLNARRFYGLKTVELSGRPWQDLVDFAECRLKPAPEARLKDVCAILQLKRVPVKPLTLDKVRKLLVKGTPVILPIQTETAPYHAALAIGIEGDIVGIVNYYGYCKDEIITPISWEKLRLVEEQPCFAVKRVT